MSKLLCTMMALVVFTGMAQGVVWDLPFTVLGRVAVTGIAVTGDPFDELPLTAAGIRTGLTPRFSLEATLGAGRWSDYLGIYGGKYNFKLIRLGGGVHYSLWSQESRLINLRAGIRFLYYFLRVDNDLGNPYPGDLESCLAVVPTLVLDFSPFYRNSGFLGRLILIGTLEYPVNGGFSTVTGSVGLGFRVH